MKSRFVWYLGLISLVGILFSFASLVATVNESASEVNPILAAIFLVSLLVLLWSIWRFSSLNSPREMGVGIKKVLRLFLSGLAIAGAIFMLLLVLSFFVYGSAGIEFVFDRLPMVVLLGFLVGLPISWFRLRP